MPETPITTATFIQRCDRHPHADLGPEVLVMNMERGNYYGLGATGTRIWQLVASRIRARDVCAALVEEFAVAQDTCEEQVLRFLEHMRAEGLLNVSTEKD